MFMVFQLYKTATSVSTTVLQILLKTVISILGNEREYITDTCVYVFMCADFTLARMTMQSQEEKSYSCSESETDETD